MNPEKFLKELKAKIAESVKIYIEGKGVFEGKKVKKINVKDIIFDNNKEDILKLPIANDYIFVHFDIIFDLIWIPDYADLGESIKDAMKGCQGWKIKVFFRKHEQNFLLKDLDTKGR
jgi:hypothetical protein